MRVHHRLVFIHPWPNGNGRHARLLADVMIARQGRPPFTWGAQAELARPGSARTAYLAALRAADAHDFAPLLTFARS